MAPSAADEGGGVGMARAIRMRIRMDAATIARRRYTAGHPRGPCRYRPAVTATCALAGAPPDAPPAASAASRTSPDSLLLRRQPRVGEPADDRRQRIGLVLHHPVAGVGHADRGQRGVLPAEDLERGPGRAAGTPHAARHHEL